MKAENRLIFAKAPVILSHIKNKLKENPLRQEEAIPFPIQVQVSGEIVEVAIGPFTLYAPRQLHQHLPHLHVSRVTHTLKRSTQRGNWTQSSRFTNDTQHIPTVNQKEIMNQLKWNSWGGSSSYPPFRMDFTGSFGHSNLIQKVWKDSIYNNNVKFQLITHSDTNFLLYQVASDDSVHISFFSILDIWLRHFFLFKEELQGARYHTMLKGYFILCLWPR